MKQKTLLILLFASKLVCSQMTIDLGSDTVFCPPYPDSTQVNHLLGTNLLISQGTPPYTYLWETDPYYFPNSGFTLYTSDYLNDTTLANPILSGGRDTMAFILTVTDAAGQTASDSITVYNPLFFIHLGYFIHAILPGDSIQLGCSNIAGGMGPLTYLWRPNHGLLDSTNATFWTKPTVTTAYYPTVTDSAGCKAMAGTACIVVISGLDVIDHFSENSSTIALYPNPTTGKVQLKDGKKLAKRIQIFNANGQFITEVLPTNFPYDMSHFAKGTYHLKITTSTNVEQRIVILK